MEAGKGLEMRKLVLSGFLASEEIYINQLEALLLVSLCSGLQSASCLQTAFGVGGEGGPGPVLPCGQSLSAWHWAARVIAKKGPVPLSPSPP